MNKLERHYYIKKDAGTETANAKGQISKRTYLDKAIP